MAPPQVTEDYYLVLGVESTATLEIISRSYKQLAFKLHPDRNKQHNATEAFQLLGKAYDMLKDEDKRRTYDLIYPFIKSPTTPHKTHKTPPPTSAPRSEPLDEKTQIAQIQRSLQERKDRWLATRKSFDSKIFELQRGIRWLEQEIGFLNSIAVAEAAEEAQKKSWTTWLLSPIYKKVEETEEERNQKDRERQERRIEKDMKERRLEARKTDLKREESLLQQSQSVVDAEDRADQSKISKIQQIIWDRENAARIEKEKAERERQAKIWARENAARIERERAEQERQAKIWARENAARIERERAEQERQLKIWARENAAKIERQERSWKEFAQGVAAARKQEEEEAVARQKRQEEHLNFFDPQWPHSFNPDCRHNSWWAEIQGRAPCPKCSEVWTYLLKCPGCKMVACPRCKAAIRPRGRRAHPRARAPGTDYISSRYD